MIVLLARSADGLVYVRKRGRTFSVARPYERGSIRRVDLEEVVFAVADGLAKTTRMEFPSWRSLREYLQSTTIARTRPIALTATPDGPVPEPCACSDSPERLGVWHWTWGQTGGWECRHCGGAVLRETVCSSAASPNIART